MNKHTYSSCTLLHLEFLEIVCPSLKVENAVPFIFLNALIPTETTNLKNIVRIEFKPRWADTLSVTSALARARNFAKMLA